MSANLTRTNYVPRFQITAKDRAAQRWNVEQPQGEESARHIRMIRAIRRLPAPVVAPEPTLVVSHMANGDPTYWRRRAHEIQNDLRRKSCAVCKGTGEIWVYIDYPPDPCPSCQQAFLDPDAAEVSAF